MQHLLFDVRLIQGIESFLISHITINNMEIVKINVGGRRFEEKYSDLTILRH